MNDKSSGSGFFVPLIALLFSVIVLVIVLDFFAGDSPPDTSIQVQAVAGQGTLVLDERRELNVVAGQNLLPGVDLRTSSDSRIALFWAGFDLRLNENTRVILNNDHIALISGELYISNRDRRITRRQVVVKTPQAFISDIGTQFRVWLADNRTHASVRQGSILVETPSAEHRLEATGDGPSTLVVGADGYARQLDAGSDWTWIYAVTRPFETAGASVFRLLRWSTNETGRRLVFADNDVSVAARNHRFDGDFMLDLRDPEEAPLTALQVTRFKAEPMDDGSLLVSLRAPQGVPRP